MPMAAIWACMNSAKDWRAVVVLNVKSGFFPDAR
jgi:hypothetical protein